MAIEINVDTETPKEETKKGVNISFEMNARRSIDGNIMIFDHIDICLLYTSPSPRDQRGSRMPSSA